MPTISKRRLIAAPYGLPDTFSVWFIDDTLGEKNYTDKLLYYKVTKRINNLWFAELTLSDIGSTEKDYVKHNNTVKLFSNNTIVFKGVIDKAEYDSYNNAKVYLYGVAVKMKESSIDDTYTNTATSTIVTDLAADTGLTINTNDNFGNVTVSFYNENKLKGISDLANNVGYYWYESYGDNPYNTDYINFASTQGSSSSVYDFTISGASQNVITSSKDTSRDKQTNYIIALGYGDGVNQLKSEIYHATDNRSTLASDITATATTITLTDATDFPASGNVWIGCEKVSYSGKSGNNLTGCGRGVAFMGNVYEAYAHSANSPVYDAQYTTSSPESNSSIDQYGLIQQRFTNKSIVDQNTLDKLAADLLSKYKNPVEMITVTISDPFDALDNISLGDQVTVTDAEADLSGNYQVTGMVFGFNEKRGEFMDIELSNKKESFSDVATDIGEKAERVNVYMQGATNIYAINTYENGDATHYVNMRFYLPTDAIAINAIKLNFKLEDFRAYTSSSQTSSSESSHTHTVDISDHYHIFPILTYSTDTSGGTTRRYVETAGVGPTYVYVNTSSADNVYGNTDTGTVYDGEAITSSGGSAHSHTITMSFGIYEETLTSPSVDVYIGQDGGSMSLIDTYTANQTDVDLTTQVRNVGAGKWINIQFRPNKRMRIEANAYVQIFIQSK